MNIAQRLINEGKEEGILQGMQQGMQRGMQQGIDLGMQQGRLESLIEVARMLISTGQDVDYVSEVTGLSIEQIINLRGH